MLRLIDIVTNVFPVLREREEKKRIICSEFKNMTGIVYSGTGPQVGTRKLPPFSFLLTYQFTLQILFYLLVQLKFTITTPRLSRIALYSQRRKNLGLTSKQTSKVYLKEKKMLMFI